MGFACVSLACCYYPAGRNFSSLCSKKIRERVPIPVAHQFISESSSLSRPTNLQQPEKAVYVYPPSTGFGSMFTLFDNIPKTSSQPASATKEISERLRGLGQRVDIPAASPSSRLPTLHSPSQRRQTFTIHGVKLGTVSSQEPH